MWYVCGPNAPSYTSNIKRAEHKFGKIASNWTSHRSFIAWGIAHKYTYSAKYNVMHKCCDNVSQQVYMWWKKMTLFRDVVIIYHKHTCNGKR